jgi:hypothetical protein
MTECVKFNIKRHWNMNHLTKMMIFFLLNFFWRIQIKTFVCHSSSSQIKEHVSKNHFGTWKPSKHGKMEHKNLFSSLLFCFFSPFSVLFFDVKWRRGWVFFGSKTCYNIKKRQSEQFFSLFFPSSSWVL